MDKKILEYEKTIIEETIKSHTEEIKFIRGRIRILKQIHKKIIIQRTQPQFLEWLKQEEIIKNFN